MPSIRREKGRFPLGVGKHLPGMQKSEERGGRETAMARLEDLTAGAVVRGVLPLEPVTVVSVKW